MFQRAPARQASSGGSIAPNPSRYVDVACIVPQGTCILESSFDLEGWEAETLLRLTAGSFTIREYDLNENHRFYRFNPLH